MDSWTMHIVSQQLTPLKYGEGLIKKGKLKTKIGCVWENTKIIQNDPDFPPNKVDTAFKIWESKGLSWSHQLYDEVGYESFDNLVKKYQLPRSHFYRYLQVRSYLNKNIPDIKLNDLHPVVRQILKIIQSGIIKKVTGQIYQILQQEEEKITKCVNEKWENEMKISIPEMEWEQSFRNIYTNLRSLYWQEYAWKVNIRYFLTPLSMKYAQAGGNVGIKIQITHTYFLHALEFNLIGKMLLG